MLILVKNNIYIETEELKFSFIRASGPGGQNVNKVSTAVQLKFDVANTDSFTDKVKVAVIKNAGRRITNDGILIIEAKRFRTQEKNKQDAIDRLIALVRKSAEFSKPRKKTKPTNTSIEKRIENKKKKKGIKKQREKVKNDL